MDILLFTTRLAILACRHMVPFYYSKENVKASDIAKVYGFNVRSLSPALTTLVNAGILVSQVGGPDRGFSFARSPKEVTLYDIVRALEGEVGKEGCSCVHTCGMSSCELCTLKDEMQSVVDKRRQVLSAKTLYDHYKDLLSQEAEMPLPASLAPSGA